MNPPNYFQQPSRPIRHLTEDDIEEIVFEQLSSPTPNLTKDNIEEICLMRTGEAEEDWQEHHLLLLLCNDCFKNAELERDVREFETPVSSQPAPLAQDWRAGRFGGASSPNSAALPNRSLSRR